MYIRIDVKNKSVVKQVHQEYRQLLVGIETMNC